MPRTFMQCPSSQQGSWSSRANPGSASIAAIGSSRSFGAMSRFLLLHCVLAELAETQRSSRPWRTRC